MSVYMTGDDTKELTKVDKTDTNNTVIIPTFDVHSKPPVTETNQEGSQLTPTSFDIIWMIQISSKR